MTFTPVCREPMAARVHPQDVRSAHQSMHHLVADADWSDQGLLAAVTARAASGATPWLEHVKRVFPDEWRHIPCWLAHRVQRPGEKINHALVLGGKQGIGKDSLLEPVKEAVGRWNWREISPTPHCPKKESTFVRLRPDGSS